MMDDSKKGTGVMGQNDDQDNKNGNSQASPLNQDMDKLGHKGGVASKDSDQLGNVSEGKQEESVKHEENS